AIAIRVIERAGKGIRDVPRDALIGLSEGKTNLGFAYGFRKLMDNMGAILGPLLATIMIAFLFENTTSEEAYRTIFAIAIIPATLAVIGLIFLKDRYTEKTPVRKILREVFQVQEFKQFLIAGFVFSLGHFSIMFFLLRANDFIPLVLIPVSYLAFNVFYTMFSIPAGILSDRIGPRITIIFGMFLFLFVLCAFAFFPSVSIIFLAFAVLGFFMAIIEEAPKIFMVKSVKENYFASAIGSYKGLVGISALPANLIAGLLYSITILETPATFIFAIITTIVGIILMITLVKE
ncbi:MAG: MFS transporter, partial [Candidatus Hodarchaeales archaeon]